MNDEAQNLVLSSLLGLADLRVFSVLLGVSLSGYALQMAFYGTHRQMSLWSIWVVYPAKTCFEASALLSGGLCGLTLASSILWGSWQWSLLSARTFVITTALCVSIPLFFWFVWKILDKLTQNEQRILSICFFLFIMVIATISLTNLF